MTSEKSYMPLESEDDELDFATTSKPDTRWRTRFWLLAVFSGLLLLCSWLVILLQANSSTSYRHQYGNKVEVPYSPARPYLQYANRYMTQDPDTPKFMGKPRPELDQAWHDLLEGTLIKFSGTELQRAGNASSVAHKEAGFVGGLGISHSLHCLKRIKQYMYPEYYYSHEEQNWDELESHADHCLESLRQTLLCQPDISVYTLEWTPHSRVKPTVRVPQAHVCVDWSKLHGWMLERAAKLEDMVPADPSLYEKHGKNSTRRDEQEEMQ